MDNKVKILLAVIIDDDNIINKAQSLKSQEKIIADVIGFKILELLDNKVNTIYTKNYRSDVPKPYFMNIIGLDWCPHFKPKLKITKLSRGFNYSLSCFGDKSFKYTSLPVYNKDTLIHKILKPSYTKSNILSEFRVVIYDKTDKKYLLIYNFDKDILSIFDTNPKLKFNLLSRPDFMFLSGEQISMIDCNSILVSNWKDYDEKVYEKLDKMIQVSKYNDLKEVIDSSSVISHFKANIAGVTFTDKDVYDAVYDIINTIYNKFGNINNIQQFILLLHQTIIECQRYTDKNTPETVKDCIISAINNADKLDNINIEINTDDGNAKVAIEYLTFDIQNKDYTLKGEN